MYRIGSCLLGDRLKKADLSQSQLAEMTNISKSQISEYVNNKHVMSLESALNIAYALNCSIEELYQWESVTDDQYR